MAQAEAEHDRDKPLFMISVVADMLDIHPQTLRLYEREGLVVPQRTGGNTRLYSQEDIDKLRRVLRLTRDLGVNLAGVEVILSMRDKMEQMQDMMEQLLHYIQTELHKQQQVDPDAQSANALVKIQEHHIMIKHEHEH